MRDDDPTGLSMLRHPWHTGDMFAKLTTSASIILWSAILAVACGGTAVVDSEAAPGTGGVSAGGASSAGAGGTTGTAGTGGVAGAQSCQELEGPYANALDAAKQCDSLINAVQCTMLMPNRVVCPCDTYVNPSNDEAIEVLTALLEAAIDMGCACAADYDCPPLQAGGCASDSGEVDTCVDYGND